MGECRVVDQVSEVDVYSVHVDVHRRMHQEWSVWLWMKRGTVSGVDTDTSEEFTSLPRGRLLFRKRKLVFDGQTDYKMMTKRKNM